MNYTAEINYFAKTNIKSCVSYLIVQKPVFQTTFNYIFKHLNASSCISFKDEIKINTPTTPQYDLVAN